MPTDPWIIMLVCPTQANAKLMLKAIRDAGIESSAAISKRSEARAVLGEVSQAAPKTYNTQTARDIEGDTAAKVARIRKAQPRATRNRL